MTRSIQLMVALAATSLCASASAAAVLVVRSTGPSATVYPAGKALGDAQVLKLKANDMIVLLDSRGTRTLHGRAALLAAASWSLAIPAPP